MSVEVDQEKWTRAQDFLQSRVSRETDSTAGKPLIELLLNVPGIFKLADVITDPAKPASLGFWSQETPLAQNAFEFAGLGITAAVDGLMALSCLVLKAQSITPLGCFTLIRQVAENSVIANWCLEKSDVQSLKIRGLAVSWDNMKEQSNFANALGHQPYIEQVKLYRANLIESARCASLYDFNKRGPIKTLEGFTELFKKIQFGNTSLEWFYRSLSGAAHGKAWTQLSLTETSDVIEGTHHTDLGVPQSFGLMNMNPDVSLIAQWLEIALVLMNRAIETYITTRNLPTPVNS